MVDASGRAARTRSPPTPRWSGWRWPTTPTRRPCWTHWGDLRVLCALRRGPQGAQAWNDLIESELRHAVPGFRTDRTWYVGRPILVTENDHGLRLYNGDVGVVLRDPDDPDRRVAVFPATDGSLRQISPARLPACETTFAMTIHKSQGSQFGHAVVVLPDTSSPVLTRELVYTAITRATRATTILARADRLAEAIARPVQRATGLQQRLWQT
jgi:exodeoxyribonuclease V alpha subunit